MTPRSEAIKDLPPAAPGMDVIVNAHKAAFAAAVDLGKQADWPGALAKVPEWRRQLELAEAALATYTQNKKAFDDIDGPLKADLAQAMKLGAVTPAMGVLCKAVRDQAPQVKTAGDALDYAAGIPLIQELATRGRSIAADAQGLRRRASGMGGAIGRFGGRK